MIVLHPSSRCDVCLDPFTTDVAPHAIPCGHIFCQPCLSSINPSNCPMCRKAYHADRAKKLHVDRLESSDESQSLDLLQRLILAWDNEQELPNTITEVEAWLQARHEDACKPLRKARDGVARFQRYQMEKRQQAHKIHRLEQQLETMERETGNDRSRSQEAEAGFLSQIQDLELRLAESNTKSDRLRNEISRIMSKIPNPHTKNPLPAPPVPIPLDRFPNFPQAYTAAFAPPPGSSTSRQHLASVPELYQNGRTPFVASTNHLPDQDQPEADEDGRRRDAKGKGKPNYAIYKYSDGFVPGAMSNSRGVPPQEMTNVKAMQESVARMWPSATEGAAGTTGSSGYMAGGRVQADSRSDVVDPYTPIAAYLSGYGNGYSQGYQVGVPPGHAGTTLAGTSNTRLYTTEQGSSQQPDTTHRSSRGQPSQHRHKEGKRRPSVTGERPQTSTTAPVPIPHRGILKNGTSGQGSLTRRSDGRLDGHMSEGGASSISPARNRRPSLRPTTARPEVVTSNSSSSGSLTSVGHIHGRSVSMDHGLNDFSNNSFSHPAAAVTQTTSRPPISNETNGSNHTPRAVNGNDARNAATTHRRATDRSSISSWGTVNSSDGINHNVRHSQGSLGSLTDLRSFSLPTTYDSSAFDADSFPLAESPDDNLNSMTPRYVPTRTVSSPGPQFPIEEEDIFEMPHHSQHHHHHHRQADHTGGGGPPPQARTRMAPRRLPSTSSVASSVDPRRGAADFNHDDSGYMTEPTGGGGGNALGLLDLSHPAPAPFTVNAPTPVASSVGFLRSWSQG